MNRLETRLYIESPILYGSLQETKKSVNLLLQKYSYNFPEYTDHSIEHTQEVFNIVNELLTEEELNNLNIDEVYILCMSSYLHDVGMCLPEKKISQIGETREISAYRERNPELDTTTFIRNIHHELSEKFILEEWELLKIPNFKYAEAIGLVSKGHRIVDIGNPDDYTPKFFVKTGRDFVCLPYLAAILRIADELDITNIRTPKLLTKYYMPDNKKSLEEWQKHIATTMRNYDGDSVLFEVNCSNHSMLAALEDQFTKIQDVINYSQKTIRNISNTENRKYTLTLREVKNNYKFINFDPKGIKYSFDVENVINTFVGEKLYGDKLTTLREAIQNSIDTCRYKKVLEGDNYSPFIKITLSDEAIVIEDNGLGMDEFIIQNYFSKLGSSYYLQESVMKNYEGIGQFGVGVFSYFLMGEYIDIETKTKDSITLNFRLDRDPKNYFHFFNEYNRTDSGTTMKINLKDEFKNYNHEKLINYIKNTFKYIDIPISILSKSKELIHIKEEFSFGNISELLKNGLGYFHKNKLKNIAYHTYRFEDNDIEGLSLLLYIKDYSTFEIEDFFDDNSLFSEVNTVIYNKGVYITKEINYEFNYNSDFSFYTIVNFKNKIDLLINRNSLGSSLNSMDKKIKNIGIRHLEKLIKENIHIIPDLVQHRISLKVIRNWSPKMIASISEVLKILIKTGNGQKFVDLNCFLSKKYLKIYLVEENTNTESLKCSNEVICIVFNEVGISSLNYVFNKFGYYATIERVENFNYYLLIPEETNLIVIEKEEFNDIFFTDTINFNKVLLTKNEEDLKTNPVYNFNIKHPFIKKLIELFPNIVEDLKTNIVLKELFNAINSRPTNSNLKIINQLVAELTESTKINYTFSRNDYFY